MADDGGVIGYMVVDETGEDTSVAVPTDGLDNPTGIANGILVVSSPDLLRLVRRFVNGCNAQGMQNLCSQLLHAWTDAAQLLQQMDDEFGTSPPSANGKGGAA